jgi:hypothetical protein
MKTTSIFRIVSIAMFLATAYLSAGEASAGPIGPSPYLSFADSPFNGGSFSYFYLETFEDHLLNTPGVTANTGGVTSVVFGPSIHDSVDADDGAIDGSGLAGDSYFSSNGSAGVRFTFDAATLGTLPSHAGIVWTDGGGTTSFEAFDALNNSLGIIGPVAIADGSNNGETAEDRFFGWTNVGGISSILISNTSGGIEVDHLQYGFAASVGAAVPEPASLVLFATGLVAVVVWRLTRNPALVFNRSLPKKRSL